MSVALVELPDGTVIRVNQDGTVLSDDIDLQPLAEQIANQSVSESDGLLVLVIAKRIANVMRGKVHASIDYAQERSLQEAFCPTGKGGKRDPHCSPKNKGTGKKSRISEIVDLKNAIEVYDADDPNAYEEQEDDGELEAIWKERELPERMKKWKSDGTLYAIYKENEYANTQRHDETLEWIDRAHPEVAKEFRQYWSENWVREYKVPANEALDDMHQHLAEMFGEDNPAVQFVAEMRDDIADSVKALVDAYADEKKAEWIANQGPQDFESKQKKDMQWVNNSNSYELNFETSNGSVFDMHVSTNKSPRLGRVADLVFVDSQGSFDITGKGGTKTALEVFKKVTASSLAYLDHDKPGVLHFSSAEPSRSKLYERLVRTAATENPDYVPFRNFQADGGATFALVKKDTLDEFKKLYQEKGYTISEEELQDTSAKTFVKIGESQQMILMQLTPGIDDKWFEEESWADETPTQVQEAFCATGKGGKRDPHCSPKNKGTGKAKPASSRRTKKQEPIKIQSEKAPEKIDASKWEDESKSVTMRMSALGQAGHKLTPEQHADAYWKLHKAYYSDANRENAIGLADQMLKDAKSGNIDEEYMQLGKQLAQQAMRDEYYKTTQSKERRKASEFEPTEEAIKAKASELQATAAKEDIDRWELQSSYLKKMQKENVPDSEGMKTVANRSRAEHIRSVADALKRGQDVPADNVIRYLGSSTLPPEETKRFMTAHSSMEANRELQAFSKVAESHAPAIEKALKYGASVREGFVSKAKEYLSQVDQASKNSMVAEAKLAKATSELGKIKESAAEQGIKDLASLPADHPIAKQYNAQINSIKQLSIASQDASQAMKDSNEVFHELLSHSDRQKPAIYALGVGYRELPKTVQEKADKAARFFEKVLHPSVIGGSSEAVEIDLGSSGDRAHAMVDKKVIAMDQTDAAETFVHEMAHVFESNSKQSDYAAMSSAFLFNRAKETQGSDVPKASHMGSRYRSNEQRVEDKLSGAYAEKWYGGRYASEVISMGAQQLFSDPLRFAEEHPDHFDFTVAYLHGKVQNEVISGDVAER